ncbi:MAG: sulfurtransferase TusA family protein [Acidobacteria bacterium]|nr:sulfurtransferase TusA family protein [Acidobacteriota bacterium]
MAEQIIDRTLDCTGLTCPMPIMKTTHAIRELRVGQVLEMIASDPGSMADMEAWSKQNQHELLAAETLSDGRFRFLIRKTH